MTGCKENALAWYQKQFHTISNLLLNVSVRNDELSRKYGGEILCENIAPIPTSLDVEELVKIFQRDGIKARLNASGSPVIIYREKEAVQEC